MVPTATKGCLVAVEDGFGLRQLRQGMTLKERVKAARETLKAITQTFYVLYQGMLVVDGGG